MEEFLSVLTSEQRCKFIKKNVATWLTELLTSSSTSMIEYTAFAQEVQPKLEFFANMSGTTSKCTGTASFNLNILIKLVWNWKSCLNLNLWPVSFDIDVPLQEPTVSISDSLRLRQYWKTISLLHVHWKQFGQDQLPDLRKWFRLYLRILWRQLQRGHEFGWGQGLHRYRNITFSLYNSVKSDFKWSQKTINLYIFK